MLTRVGLVLVVLATLVVTMPASPVHISYVYSDSMEPTIGQDDGYVIVPADTVETREIVVFWSSERDEYVTHRVTGRSEAGLITRGDNNAVTDQAAGHPHVQRDDVVGEVLTVAGEPVTIPGLGVLVSFVRSYRLLLLGGALLLIGSGLVFGGGGSTLPPRSPVRVSDVMHPIFGAVIVGGVAIMVLGTGGHELAYVAIDGGSSAASTLTVGEPTTQTILVNATALPLTYRVLGTDGMTIENSTSNASTISADVRIPAPTEPGAYTKWVTVHRYPAVLPRPIVETLHGLHPAIAATVTTCLTFTPFALLYGLFFDGNGLIRPTPSPWGRRVRRWMR